MAKITKAEAAHLAMFGPDTHSIKLGPIGKTLERKGLVEWVPSWMAGGYDYRITPAGRAALANTGGDRG